MIVAGRRGRVVAGIAGVLAVGAVALLVGAAVGGDDDPAAGGRRPRAGFDEVAIRIDAPDGRTLDWCALLAETAAAREQGLMEQEDLGGYDAMVFRFPEPTTSAFYMYRTVLPLSIAWFGEGGAFVSARDMPPCPADDPAGCPTYEPAGPYVHAVEVERGGLARLGAEPGSSLSFPGGGCA